MLTVTKAACRIKKSPDSKEINREESSHWNTSWTMTMLVQEDVQSVLSALRWPQFWNAFWNPKGEVLNDYPTKSPRHKIENVELIFEDQGKKMLDLVGDLSNIKLEATGNHELNLAFKVDAELNLDKFVILEALKRDGTQVVSLRERQLDIHSVAA
jgi:hypothetical protein